MSNPAALLSATSALLGTAIEVILRDQFYQDLIVKMRQEGRTVPTLMELESAKIRVKDALATLDEAIKERETGPADGE